MNGLERSTNEYAHFFDLKWFKADNTLSETLDMQMPGCIAR